MQVTVGSFSVRSHEFPSYDEMKKFVVCSGENSLLFGENAAAFVSFWALEGRQVFGDSAFRVGVILDHECSGPHLFPSPDGGRVAIGINSEVIVLSLSEPLVSQIFSLDSWFQGFLHDGNILVGVHELGAVILRLPAFDEVGTLYCEIVSRATLSDRELVLISAENESACLDLRCLR